MYERVSGITSRVAWVVFVGLLAIASVSTARAQQFVLLDQTYTATTANTSDSHFKVPPSKETPNNWTSPVAYAPNGTVHAHFEVLSKPSAVKTDYNICLDGTGSTCMGSSPLYTGTGTYDFSNVIQTFWNSTAYTWSKPVNDVALIMKDANGTKQQGSADFYPTTIHVVLTVVAPGSTYVPPTKTMMDAGMPDAGMPDAGMPDAGMPDAGGPRHDAGAQKMMSDNDAGTPKVPTAGSPSLADAGANMHGSAGAAAQAGRTAGAGGSISNTASSSSGSAASAGSAGTTTTLNPVRPVKGGNCAVSELGRSETSELSWLCALGFAFMRFARKRRSTPP